MPMRPRAVTIGLALGALLASSAASAESRPVAVETCLGCHGIPGYKNAYPTYPVPKLGGQHALYIADALRAYANGDRPHSTMHAQAATLSDEEIQIIATWFEEQGK
jgi:cytochrome c553